MSLILYKRRTIVLKFPERRNKVMSRTIKTFPHFEINVKATDNYKPRYDEILPLHRPIFCMRAARGPVNVPVWCPQFIDAKAIYGDETFDEYGQYFSREAMYVKRLMTRQGCFIVRLADDKAAFASAVIEAHIQLDANITQYELDLFGNRVLDGYGNPIPRIDGSNNIVTSTGMKVKYTSRALTAGEDFDSLKERTIRVNNKDVLVVPICCFKAENPSSLYNNCGFKLFFDNNDNDANLVFDLKTLFYTFMPVEKPYRSDTVQPIYNFYSYTNTTFTLKPNQVNASVDKRVSAEDVLVKEYTDTDDTNLLPYKIHFYNTYIAKVCKLIQKYEAANNMDLSDSEWMANILSLRDREDRPYVNVELVTSDNDAIIFDENYIIYLTGGSDGDISDEVIEDLTRQYLALKIYPELNDQARYPITHVYDTGVSLLTKYALIDFLSVRDDVKVSLSTQDANRKLNTKAEDQSCGSALRARCLLQPESLIMGTGCCRAEIMQQAGYLVESNYKGIVPMTYELLDKRSEWQSTQSMRGNFKGLPNSNINYIKGFWSPCTDDHKQRSWDSGLNYAQFYDMHRLHWMDVRTVYDYETSVLSDTTFTDCVVYAKHIIRRSHATHSGLTLPAAELHRLIEKDINDKMYAMCGNMYPASAKAYQTEEEMRLGYITHVILNITGYGSNRVMIVDVVCNRENYSA